MSNFKQMLLCRWIAVVLIALLAVPAGTLQATAPDPLETGFSSALQAWRDGNMDAARATLLEIMSTWDGNRVREDFRGKVHLLMGAVTEKLDRDEESIEHFCLARTLLGDEIPLEGFNPREYSNYSAACSALQMIAIGFQQARILFLAGEYARARVTLESEATKMDAAGGDKILRGKICLLLGAIHEKLKNRKESTHWFCRAKELLGQGRSFSWLELSEYKYYTVSCKGGVVAVPGKKKGFGRFLGFLLGLAVIGGAVWYLFINKNSPLKKKEDAADPGNYTSITFRMQVTYKGLNSKGQRKLMVDGEVKNNENFTFSGNADSNSTCEDAQVDKTITVTKTITGNSVTISQQYLNWDYVHFVTPGTNHKLLCTDWTFSIQSYTWETGKDDPGSPQPSGLANLGLDTENDCTQVTTRKHNCTTEATITFNRPGTGSAATWNVSQTKVRSGSAL